MRFPFTFMGLMSLALGIWMFSYLIAHPQMEPFAGGLVVMTAFGMVAFGSFVVYERLVRRRQP